MKHTVLVAIAMCTSIVMYAANDVPVVNLDEKSCQLINAYVNALSNEVLWNIPTFDISSAPESDKKGALLQAVLDSAKQEQWTSQMQAVFSRTGRIHLANATVEERNKKRDAIKKLVIELMSMQPQEKHSEQATVDSNDSYTRFDACKKENNA